MDELIFKKQALDAINKCREDYNISEQEPIDDCENAVRELQPVTERTGYWIPVTERLPEVGSIVLCYCKHRAWMVGKINVCKYCAADKYKDAPYFDYNMNDFPEVIAWMPLPEPYEKGGETE